MRTLLPILLLTLVVSAVCGPKAVLAVDSFPLLEGLWSPESLEGTDEDRIVGPRCEPDLRPPARQTPRHTLPALSPKWHTTIRSVQLPSANKSIALTFDLCELSTKVAGYQNQIVNYLRRHGVRATFFAGGKWMRSHPEKTLQMMADPRFEIGNHAWTHGNMAVLQSRQIVDQVQWAQAQYELLHEELAQRAEAAGLSAEMSKISPVPRLFRLPYGRCNAQALETLGGLGLRVIQWDVVGEHNECERTVETLADTAINKTGPGSIILLHANGVPSKTFALLQQLIPRLRQQGYRFVTVSELLPMGEPVSTTEGYFTQIGDNLSLDVLYGDGTSHPLRRK